MTNKHELEREKMEEHLAIVREMAENWRAVGNTLRANASLKKYRAMREEYRKVFGMEYIAKEDMREDA